VLRVEIILLFLPVFSSFIDFIDLGGYCCKTPLTHSLSLTHSLTDFPLPSTPPHYPYYCSIPLLTPRPHLLGRATSRDWLDRPRGASLTSFGFPAPPKLLLSPPPQGSPDMYIDRNNLISADTNKYRHLALLCGGTTDHSSCRDLPQFGLLLCLALPSPAQPAAPAHVRDLTEFFPPALVSSPAVPASTDRVSLSLLRPLSLSCACYRSRFSLAWLLSFFLSLCSSLSLPPLDSGACGRSESRPLHWPASQNEKRSIKSCLSLS
jgi:hypothetical protein